jgi:hypothetical protein
LFQNPIIYNGAGYGGNTFTYNTPNLIGGDSYTVGLFCDFVLVKLTVNTPSSPTAASTIAPTNKPSVFPTLKSTVFPTVVSSTQTTLATSLSSNSISSIKPSSKPSSTPQLTSSFPSTSKPSNFATAKPSFVPTTKATALLTSSSSVSTGSVVFFSSDQSYTLDTSGTYSNLLTSNGYRFTYSQNKVITSVNNVEWPTGLHLQALTSGSVGPAKATIARTDKKPFSIPSFSVTLLCNAVGGSASFKWVPKLLGEDLLNDEVIYSTNGYGTGTKFTFDTLNSLSGGDSYSVTFPCDVVLNSITVSL